MADDENRQAATTAAALTYFMRWFPRLFQKFRQMLVKY